MKNLLNKKTGFTIMDILLTAAIISFLSSVFLFNVSEAKKKAEDSKMIQESSQIAVAVELYKSTTGFVPHSTHAAGVVYREGGADDAKYRASLQPLVDGGFLQSIPVSPDGQSYSYGYSTDFQDSIFVSSLHRGGTHSVLCELEDCGFVFATTTESQATTTESQATSTTPQVTLYSLTVNNPMLKSGIILLNNNYDGSSFMSPTEYQEGEIASIYGYARVEGVNYPLIWTGCDSVIALTVCQVTMTSNKTISVDY